MLCVVVVSVPLPLSLQAATPSRTRSAVAIYGSHVRLVGFHIRNPTGRGISEALR